MKYLSLEDDGSFFWNIFYDRLLGLVLVVVTFFNAENEALKKIESWMIIRHLEIAPEKTEALLLTQKRGIE